MATVSSGKSSALWGQYVVEKYRLLRSKYRSSHFCVKSKAAVIILVWGLLAYLVFDLIRNYAIQPHVAGVKLQIIPLFFTGLPLLWCCYPLGGFIADVCCGRFKTVIVSLWILWCGILFSCVVLLIMIPVKFNLVAYNLPLYVHIIIYSVLLLLMLVGLSGFQANVVQFGTDHLRDAATVHVILFVEWYIFLSNLSEVLSKVVVLNHLPKQNKLYENVCLYSLPFLIFALLTVTLVLTCFKRQWFVVDPGSRNPYKLVYRVLRFAAKNKCPIQRSAFTYCEDELPSRIDFGKHKYGGPFTTEEVEDVKTFLGILKLLLAMGPAFGLEIAVYYLLTVVAGHLDGFESFRHISFKDLLVNTGGFPSVLVVVLLPLHIIVLRPLIYHHIPGTLKRVGLGIICFLLVLVYYFSVDTVGHILHRNSTCLLFLTNNTSASVPLHISSYSLVIPSVFIALGYMLIYISSYEFICAQSPHEMKGLLIGVFFAVRGVFQFLGAALMEPFYFWKPLFPSCGFGYYLVNVFIAIIGLVVYTVAARRYKYRQRDEPCNVRRFVEEYYDRTTNYEPIP